MKPLFRRSLRFNFLVFLFPQKKINYYKAIVLKSVVFLFFIFPKYSYAYFQFNTNCIAAYGKIWNLQLVSASKLIGQEEKENPDNHISLLLENEVEFLKVFTSEDPQNYTHFKEICSRNLEILGHEKDSNSPLLLFSKAEIHLQSSLMRAKFQDFLSAAFELKHANSELEKNEILFPSFPLNESYLGVIEALLGNLPSNLRFVLGGIGLKADLNDGMGKMESSLPKILVCPYPFFYSESAFYYTYLSSSLSPDRKSYAELREILYPVSNESLLKTYVHSWVAMKKFQNDTAISLLKSKPSGREYSSFPILDYLTGVAYLNRLDTASLYYLSHYIKIHKGVNYVWDTNLRMAWIYSLEGENSLARKYLQNVGALTSEPITEKDKQAYKEAKKGIQNNTLLKARLLFDGGYFTRSIDLLNSTDSLSLKTFGEKLEYTYRKGRLYEALGKSQKAIFFYNRTFDLGYQEPFYFAANACLHLGLIQEKLRNYKAAEQYFERCLKLNEKEYKGSIDGEAQSGIERIKGIKSK